MARDCSPALVVDPAVAEHLEVLRLPPFRRIGVVERVVHAQALDRPLRDPVHRLRLGQAGCLEHRGSNVDHVVELAADLALRLDALRPVDDRAVTRSAPVRGDLLRPLVGRVHRVSPADRVVVVRRRRAELVDARHHELRRLEPEGSVEDDELVEAAVGRAFRARPVVAVDVVDERVIEDPEILERVDEPSDVVVGVLEEAGVDLHLAGEDGLQVVGHVVPGGDLLGAGGQLRLGRDHAELLLARERLLAQLVPALVELALVLRRPLRPHVMWRVCRSRREVDEERLVAHQRLLLTDPVDRFVGHVLGEVVALLGRLLRLDRGRPLVDRRVVLVRLAADEAVEVLEPPAARRPRVEGPHRARLPHRNLVALPELRRRVAVQLQRLGERRAGVRADRVVAGRRRRDLGDPTHPDRVVVPSAEERGPRRRAERGRVEAVELEPLGCEALRRRRLAGAAERAGGAEAGVVDQDDQDVRRTGRRTQRLDRREGRVRIAGVLVDRTVVRAVRNRQLFPVPAGGLRHLGSPLRVLVHCLAAPGQPASPDRGDPRRPRKALCQIRKEQRHE